ncbi:hypothetical protein SKM54_06500 [Acinetobacter faecalis]|uniref:hypothetical protein n=1 Tax=Acinetobacter faecalis TaxID=2665161 RepID=UPI002A90AD78|nr:hypothetical protein [Acinetobacter faecalis]MDY6482093.1 hypothetical protein [Acinetobacter faecalis]
MKPLLWTTLIASIVFTGCSKTEEAKTVVNESQYKVKDVATLQTRFEQLNEKLATDFKQFKQTQSMAFAQQLPLDVNDLKTLNMHLVASTSLKPTKLAYCDLMNGYFTEMYRLGHYNLQLLKDVKLPNAANENLQTNFSSSDQFYDFILNRYTTYRQVQQIMGYGCNLKEALR